MATKHATWMCQSNRSFHLRIHAWFQHREREEEWVNSLNTRSIAHTSNIIINNFCQAGTKSGLDRLIIDIDNKDAIYVSWIRNSFSLSRTASNEFSSNHLEIWVVSSHRFSIIVNSRRARCQRQSQRKLSLNSQFAEVCQLSSWRRFSAAIIAVSSTSSGSQNGKEEKKKEKNDRKKEKLKQENGKFIHLADNSFYD